MAALVGLPAELEVEFIGRRRFSGQPFGLPLTGLHDLRVWCVGRVGTGV